MKKIFFLFFVLIASQLFSQAPQAINYQTIVRNSSGVPMSNQSVSFRLSVLQNNINGSPVYSETYDAVSTNDIGLINLLIGKGTIVSGNFSAINWGADKYFLKVELDETGGSNYQTMGTTELLSVPYALYAEKAGSYNIIGSNDTSNTNELQSLTLNGATLSISNGNSVSLSSINTDNQTLSLANNLLSITNGNSVNLSTFIDNTDAQSLSLNGNLLSISGGNSITLPSSGGGSGWGLTGNSGTNPLTNFIGTTDAVDIVFKANNLECIRLSANGNSSIGNSNPFPNTARLAIRQPDFSVWGWTVSSDASNAGGFLYARQTANNDYTVGIGTEGAGILRIDPGYGAGAKTLFESYNDNTQSTVPTLVEITGQIKITGGSPGSSKILTSDINGLATWRVPTFNKISANGSFSNNNVPTSWTTFSFPSIFNLGLSVVEVLFMKFYSPTARTLYLRQPGNTDQESWTIVDIAAGRSVNVSVETINGQIEWYSSTSNAISWDLVGIGR